MRTSNLYNFHVNISGPIAIFGRGVTGKAVAKFCENRKFSYKIFDESGMPDEQFSKSEAKNFPIVVRSPSFYSSHEWVRLANDSGCQCMTELDLAYNFWRGKIIAITGTNGKTTTTEFLTHALNVCGESAISCGNIGNTFIEAVDGDRNSESTWAVVEVSSFQMDKSEIFRPDYVLWTNFANDHLDVHGSLRNYFNCKANLIRNLKSTNSKRNHCFVGNSVHEFCKENKIMDVLGEYSVCTNIDSMPIDSVLNVYTQRENFALVQEFWISNKFLLEDLQAAAMSFRLPDHRLQLVAKVESIDSNSNKKFVEFWNDSKSTNFHALNGALSSFDKKVILIAGGKSKNEPIEEFLRIINGHVKILLLLGDTGDILREAVESSEMVGGKIDCKIFIKRENVEIVMRDIVRYANEIAMDGDIVLLSPGFSSLDWFKNYSERGKLFEDCVLCLNSDNKYKV